MAAYVCSYRMFGALCLRLGKNPVYTHPLPWAGTGPGFQQIAFVDTETGQLQERRLGHSQEAEKFYRELKQQGASVRVGMEASGQARWFERLLAELQFICGSEMRRRFGRSGYGSRRRTGGMRNCCCACCWRIAFRGSGYRAGGIATCGNCFGIDTDWCRCARD